MKKALTVLMGLVMTCVISLPVKAQDTQPEVKLINCTAYTGGTVTCTGKTPAKGMCATDLDHVGDGWMAIVYQAIPDGNGSYKLGNMLWMLDCEDTGTEPVQDGYVLDIYGERKTDCQYIMETVYDNGANGKVFVQYVQGKG